MKKNQEVKNFQNSANIQDQLSRSCFDISPDTKKKQKQKEPPKPNQQPKTTEAWRLSKDNQEVGTQFMPVNTAL